MKDKVHFCYVGQNATCGIPHPQTGLHNMFGDIIAFSSRAKRDRFVDEYYSQSSPSVYAEKCNRSSARKYCLGQSMYDFQTYTINMALGAIDESYNSFFGGR